MKPIILGTTVYGERYANLFLKYCLPSLMAPGNLDALRAERDVGLVIHTDKETAPLLQGVPFPILDVTNEEKYLQLGRHQHYDLDVAKKTGGDYHCLMPDHVYSKNFFANMLKLVAKGHKAIARVSVSTCMEDICPALDGYWVDKTLCVPAPDLAALSLKYIHPGIRCWKANGVDYPRTHIIVWEAENVAYIHSPHCSPIYIANEVIQTDAPEIPIDNALDKAVSGDIYGVQPEDEMVMIELTPRDKRELNDGRTDLAGFCRAFKVSTGNSLRQLEIFEKGMADKINSSIMDGNYWNESDIAKSREIVCNALRG